MIWGIVPLYFGWLLNELTSSKASFRTALQTGFSFIWAALQWLYPFAIGRTDTALPSLTGLSQAVNLFVTLAVLAVGLIAFWSGLVRRFPKHARFLGHTRFGNYFMIAIYPIQSHYLAWSWDRFIAIALFAAPVWIILHFGLAPLRK